MPYFHPMHKCINQCCQCDNSTKWTCWHFTKRKLPKTEPIFACFRKRVFRIASVLRLYPRKFGCEIPFHGSNWDYKLAVTSFVSLISAVVSHYFVRMEPLVIESRRKRKKQVSVNNTDQGYWKLLTSWSVSQVGLCETKAINRCCHLNLPLQWKPVLCYNEAHMTHNLNISMFFWCAAMRTLCQTSLRCGTVLFIFCRGVRVCVCLNSRLASGKPSNS